MLDLWNLSRLYDEISSLHLQEAAEFSTRHFSHQIPRTPFATWKVGSQWHISIKIFENKFLARMFVYVHFPFVSNRTSLTCLFSISQTSTGAKMLQGRKIKN
jgi:hypothetical protein